jgi:plasmid stabilization system protein ParE
MSDNLSPENELFLNHAVAAGMYLNREEALDRAVELLKRREKLIRDVNKGIEQLNRGEGKPLDIEQILSTIRGKLELPKSKVFLSPDAYRDIIEYAHNVAKLFSVNSARNILPPDAILMSICSSFERLEKSLELGDRHRELSTGEYRSYEQSDFTIYFRYGAEGILIARVLPKNWIAMR